MDELQDYFRKLGLGPEIAALYQALHRHGPQSISQLARTSGVERTRMYRLLDEIAASNLIEVETQYKRHIFKAAPIGNVQILLSKKEQELKHLQQGLDTISRRLEQDNRRSPYTHVQFYRGAEGAKQLLWNQTKATTEQLCILHENLQVRVGSAFFDRWVKRCNEQGIKSRGIVNDHFIKTQQAWYARHHNQRLQHWQSRHITSDVFPITHSTIVYNDIVTYYNWKDGEIFGIEIHNQDIANAQRHFFEMLWQQASPVMVQIGDKKAMP